MNKVLFQTQVYLGKKFIHRLHVLNPLSNLDIVGEVLYFVVSKKQAEKIKEETPVQQAFPVTSGDNTKNQFLIKKLSINTAVEKDIVDTLPQASPTVKDMDANSLARWTMGGPIASPMSDPVDIQPLSAVEMTLPDRDSGILDLKDGASHPWLPTATKSKRIQLNPGALTRYTVPLTAKEVDVVKPHTKRRNQRAWSFMNSINQMGPSLSLEEWRKLAKSHSAVKGGSPVSYDSIDSSITLQAGNTLEANSTESVYEAHLYCTDNDFLEQSKIRLYFKGNALNEEESKLFEMPPVVSLNPAEAANNNDLVTSE